MGTVNFHSVFKIAETDIEQKVAPVLAKLLKDAETELNKLGLSHVWSEITSDAGTTRVTPAAAPEPAETTSTETAEATPVEAAATATEEDAANTSSDDADTPTEDTPPVVPPAS